MKHRRAYITFPDQHGNDPVLLNNQKKIEGVNIRFSTKVFSEAGLPSQTTFTIYNLNREDLQFLSTSAATWLLKQNLIQLYAGYDDDVNLLASGQIITAEPSGNPDVGLQVKILSGAKWMGQNIQCQKDQVSIRELLEYCADQMGYTLNIPSSLLDNEWLNTVNDTFSFSGTPFELLSKVQEMCGGFSLQSQGLNISTCNDEIYVWNAGAGNVKPALLVSKKTGMVGYPHPTTAGVEVKILLNTSIRPGDVIEVESERTPFINGQYYITSIQHDGELRSTEWYSTLNCSRQDNTNTTIQENNDGTTEQ